MKLYIVPFVTLALYASFAASASAALVEVPLGNLFDDSSGTSLSDAIATDTYQASGESTDLGVNTVFMGDLSVAQTIAPGVSFNFSGNGGGGSGTSGTPGNDSRRAGEGVPIRTTASVNTSLTSATPIEQGIGIHSNGLVTFDLNAIRGAGGLANMPTYFTAKTGLNDTSNGGDIRTALILSDDSGNVLAAYLNGEKLAVTQTAGVWSFNSAPARGLSGTGAGNRLAELKVPVGTDARYLTLAVTSNGSGISDHGVFSGANWEPNAIPLGNLFGDGAGTSLSDAIATDPRAQQASASDRYIDTALNGGMNGPVTIAAGGSSDVRFDLSNAGATIPNGGGLPGNDARFGLPIQTRGLDSQTYSSTAVIEDGIFAHANGLVTFDLDEIRLGGNMTDDTEFFFRAKAGINDSANNDGSLRTIAIVSNDSGSVIDAYINGIQAGTAGLTVSFNGSEWVFGGTIPSEITGNSFHNYNVLLGSDASFLTLATTSGASGGNDHGVFSGARLVTAAALVVPEPSAMTLAACGLLGMLGFAWRHRRSQKM